MDEPRASDHRQQSGLVLPEGLVLLIVLALVAIAARFPPSEPWEDWRLPEDLEQVSSRLTVLELSGPVDRIDWISDRLEQLELRSSRVASLPDLFGYANLERLSIQGTPIAAIGRLPPSLAFLEIGDTSAEQFAHGWPDSIEELRLAGADLYDSGPLPNHLRRLFLRGGEVRDLEELPASVDHLILMHTHLESLPDGYANLASLELRDNWRLKVSALPDALLSLTLQGPVETMTDGSQDEDGSREAGTGEFRHLTCRDLPTGLQTLRLVDDALACPDRLPVHLVELQLGAVSRQRDLLEQAKDLPGLVRARLDFASRADVELLPASLEVLELHAYLEPELPDLERFPKLRSLEVHHSFVEQLPSSMPKSLEVLNLSGTHVGLPALPSKLKDLSLASTRIRALPELGVDVRLRTVDLSGTCLEKLPQPWPPPLAGAEVLLLAETELEFLPPLPSTVRVLDISNTRIQSLAPLPGGLEELILHVGQVRSLAGLPQSVRRLRFVPRVGNGPTTRHGSC